MQSDGILTVMASLTVRQLDEALKKRLRLRAAKHGRSVEEEIRIILRAAAADSDEFADAPGDDREGAAGETKPAAARKRVLLIIGGGIAAYKSLDLIRRLRERGLAVRVAMTEAATEFVTPLAAGALAGGRVFTGLFDPDSEFDVGHIRLAREAELVVHEGQQLTEPLGRGLLLVEQNRDSWWIVRGIHWETVDRRLHFGGADSDSRTGVHDWSLALT